MKTNQFLPKAIFLFFLLTVLCSFIDQKTNTNNYLEGIIYDEFKKPLANVEVLNTTNFFVAISDINGNFKIKAKINDVLKFVYPSKITKTITTKDFCKIELSFENQPIYNPVHHNSETSDSLDDMDGDSSHTNPYKKPVVGRVLDNHGLPIPGVNINVNGTKIYVQSDFNGFYGIDAKINDRLTFSFLGMNTITVKVTNHIMNVRMIEDSKTLEEVVVTAMGIRHEDIDDELEGKVSGVMVSKSETPIKIRGIASISKTIVIDKKAAVIENKNSIKAGQLTAGELNDFSKWEYWQDISRDELNQWQKLWQMSPSNRYSVILTNEKNYPIINKTVHLIDETGQKIWSARTDNNGRAELWLNPFSLTIKNNNTDFSIVDNDNVLISKTAKEFRKGINTYKYKIPCNDLNKINIAFMIDATGSMGDEIQYLQAELNDVIGRVKTAMPKTDLSMGGNFYRDFGDEYLVKNFDFTNKIPEIISFIQKQKADGGGDTPEAVIEAYENAIENLTWEDDARAKLLFVVLDAPPHFSSENVIRLQKVAKKAAEKGIRIIPIAASGIDKSTEYLMRAMALETNGTYLFITNHSGIGNDHIEPSTKSYKVEMLNDLILRVILQYTTINNCEIIDENYSKNTKIEEQIQDNVKIEWNFFPNPTSGIVTVNIEKEASELNLSDTTGKLIIFQNKTAKQFQIDLTGLPLGIYYLKMKVNGDYLYGKIIKNS